MVLRDFDGSVLVSQPSYTPSSGNDVHRNFESQRTLSDQYLRDGERLTVAASSMRSALFTCWFIAWKVVEIDADNHREIFASIC